MAKVKKYLAKENINHDGVEYKKGEPCPKEIADILEGIDFIGQDSSPLPDKNFEGDGEE